MRCNILSVKDIDLKKYEEEYEEYNYNNIEEKRNKSQNNTLAKGKKPQYKADRKKQKQFKKEILGFEYED